MTQCFSDVYLNTWVIEELTAHTVGYETILSQDFSAAHRRMY